jgi:uncharacterized beta-barrel protein YwiB (DUF1934 family)
VQPLTSESFTTSVDIEWIQVGQAPGMIEACEGTHTYTQGMWKQKNGKNILILPVMDMDEPGYIEGSPRLAGEVNTKFYLAEDQVTFDRTGIIRWAHDFTAGRMQASILHLGGLVLPVVVETSKVNAEWTTDSGEILLDFLLTSGNDHYPVQLTVKFHKHSETGF